MTNDNHTARDARLRATLVGLASTASIESPRRGAVLARSIAVFAITGAITGGAVSTIAVAHSSTHEGELSAQIIGTQVVGTHTALFGEAILLTTSGNAVIDLGDAPDGATQIAFGTHCNDQGRFTLSLDGLEEWTSLCRTEQDTEPGHGGGASILTVSGDGPHTLSVEAAPGASFSVWASWAQQPPPPAQSLEQQAELSDGVIERAEYRAAFQRFAACMAAAGYPVQFIDDSQAVISYSTSTAAYTAGVDALCYEREFQEVDMTWQISQE